jgi:hypothetical protein
VFSFVVAGLTLECRITGPQRPKPPAEEENAGGFGVGVTGEEV